MDKITFYDESSSEEEELTVPLPEGWEDRITPTNKVYYVNHKERVTQWEHPVSGKIRSVTSFLPYGWGRQEDTEGNRIFVEYLAQRAAYTDPRLLTNPHRKRYVLKIAKAQGRFVENSFTDRTTAAEVIEGVDMTGKVAIVTGSNSGIGYETARCLASQGCHVIMACRDMTLGNSKAENIIKIFPQAKLSVIKLDLSQKESVEQFSSEFLSLQLPLHILVLNAGVLGLNWALSSYECEMQFSINYLGHFHLFYLLKDILKQSAPARVVCVSSEAHRYTNLNHSNLDLDTSLSKTKPRDYTAITAYGNSKLCCIYLALEIHRRYDQDGIHAYAVHPGVLISTRLSRNWCMYRLLYFASRCFTKTVAQGASSVVYCAASPLPAEESGLYYFNCKPSRPSNSAQNSHPAGILWDVSLRLIGEGDRREEDLSADTET
ncbi:WW domain-containing oxidoreductase isoform X1 [Oopsacas minuta]|uniref:WW domain-containing oxidoreductase n=1 Tax=Oopsacas minuta TaxID=111878 RepID=A0AAV7K996_9METZ|nr:WW domain-containing oxidoreductase isoform X1 [Oopsacas minuta]